MRRFGTDKPDLRIPWEIEDCTEDFARQGVPLFDAGLYGNGSAVVRMFIARGAANVCKTAAKKEWTRLISLLSNPQVTIRFTDSG